MDQLRNMLKNPTIAGVGGLVLGFIVGLFIFGWWLTPLEWVKAGPVDGRPDSRADYLRMALDSCATTSDAVAAQ